MLLIKMKNFHNNYFNVLDDINLSIDEAEKVAFWAAMERNLHCVKLFLK